MEAPQDVGFGRAGFSVPGGVDALRLQQLAQVTSELAAAEDMPAVVDAAVTHVAQVIRAATATLMVIEGGDRLVMVGGHGLQPGTDSVWGDIPLDHDNPASESARTGRAILLPDADSVERLYPSLAGWMPSGRSLVDMPLGKGPTVGVLGLTFEDGWLPGPGELDFLTPFADACGQAIHRIKTAEHARAASDWLEFLASASAELASSLDYRTTLARVAQLSVPALADWSAVQIVEDEVLHTLAVAHADPEKVAWAWELQRRYPPRDDAPTGAPNVVRTGVSEVYETITDEMLVAGAQDETHLRLSRELNLSSAMIVPLTTRGRTLGVFTLIRAGAGRTYTNADLSVAEDLGRRAAMAIDNARLHSQTEDIALQLQRAVLPDALDHLPGWQVATHYSPGGPADVGGDFYDAVPIDDDGLVVFIGDVMGRGIAAAAAMAQMRSAVRAYLCTDPDPAVVLERLDTMIARLNITQLATLLYARIDARGQVDFVCAGHPPPLVVSSEGETRWVDSQVQRPLGVERAERRSTTTHLSRGETLLLYTDGLVERRDEAIDAGLERLGKHAGLLAHSRLSVGLSALVEAIDQIPGGDDVTAMALRCAD